MEFQKKKDVFIEIKRTASGAAPPVINDVVEIKRFASSGLPHFIKRQPKITTQKRSPKSINKANIGEPPKHHFWDILCGDDVDSPTECVTI